MSKTGFYMYPEKSFRKVSIFLLMIFLILTLLLSLDLYAQKVINWTQYKHRIKFERISVEHGLSQSSVLCIFQDSKGFMWFGTEDGLNKYDGYTFKIYKPVPENPHSLNNNVVFSIYEDRKGVLWIGTNGGGLNKFDRDLEKFAHYKNDPDNSKSLSDNNVYSIYEDRAGNLWIGTGGGGLNKLIPSKKKDAPLYFIHYKVDPNNPLSLSNNNVTSVYEDHSGVLWIGTDGGGLNKMIPGGEKDSLPTFKHYKTDPNNPDTIGLNNVMSINEDNHGVLWIGTTKGLYKFNQENEEFTLFKTDPKDPKSLSHNFVREIYKDRSGILWIGTDGGGLNRLSPGNKEGSSIEFVRYQYDPSNPNGLNNNAVESIYEDRSGVLWIGVYYGGLNKLVLSESKKSNREKELFVHYQTIPNNSNSLSHNAVASIYEDQSNVLWVGTDGGGLNKIVSSSSKTDYLEFIHYQNEPNNPQSLSDNIVTSIKEDFFGVLWIGTFTGGLNKLVPGDNKVSLTTFIHYKADPNFTNSLSNNFVMTIYEAPTEPGVLWIGTIGGGLDRFDSKMEIFTNFNTIRDNPKNLSNDNVISIYEDRSGFLWIGTVSGLNKFNRKTETFTHYMYSPKNPEGLSNDYIRVIFEDQSGVLWIGTNGGGLNKLVPGDGINPHPTFIHFRERDGLPNNVILAILEDNLGNLWLSTNKGLSKFNPKTKTFTNYDMRDGLQSDEFNRGAYFKSKSGEMFFGGNNGFNIFHPDSIVKNKYIPAIMITDFQILNKSVPIGEQDNGRFVLKKSITETKKIELSYRHYVFSFEFASLHYVSPSKNLYKYKMEGLDKDWNKVGNRRFVTYTTLPPGGYVFRVIGSNNDGVWNEEGVSLKIKINPPFWKTWWFYGLVALLIIVSILSIHFYRVRQIIIRERKKYEKTYLSSERVREYLKTLLAFMKTNRPYLDPNLTLHKLSDMVSIPYHYLSQIINDKLNKIFFDFINQYRIGDAIKNIEDVNEKPKTIPEIVSEVGFNSQSAFNRAFKKEMHQTPTDYMTHYRIKEAVKKLAEVGDKQKLIPDIAEEVGFSSPSAFNRAFKKEMLQTPTDFINRCRIEEAIKKLSDTNEKQKAIQKIAIEVGFSSQSAFNRIFKKITKKTPSQYRKNQSN